ncbi:permease family-domain-containing protein [Gongronella butleri]|nr:permease family-domain-containing protein [Gongronella butleri]
MPRLPFLKTRRIKSPFYGPNDEISILLAIVMGLQHFLAVVGGIITPTILISGSGSNSLNVDTETRQYMISASLIVCGICSMIQIIRFRIPKTKYYIGAGLLQITGVSFANIAAAQAVISNMYKSGACPTEIAADGTTTYLPCPDAFGAILGTQLVASVLSLIIAFLPPRVIRKLFPKIVSGIVLVVIGGSLLSTGMSNWAGGSGPCAARPTSGLFALCPTINAPNAQQWGSPVNFALGASVFATILVVELCGSIFLRNIGVIVGLLVGCIIAAGVGMFDKSGIESARVITFIWVKTFKISVYAPGIIPYLFTQLDMVIETIGDLTAACDVSDLPLEGEKYEQRLRGGILADFVGTVFSSVATSMTVVTFSQNNGVIASSSMASRRAGFMCAVILIICGVFGKISAAFLAIPSPLIGGMTVFLFGMVLTAGIRILSYLEWTRRDRVIIASSLSLALGQAMVPDWFSYVLPSSTNPSIEGLYEAINTVVSTPYIVAGIMSMVLNQILPYDPVDDEKEAVPNVTTHGGAQRYHYDEPTSSATSRE